GSGTLSNLQTSLASITSPGSLTVQNGASFTAVSGFSNAGTLTVGSGGTFTETGTYTQSASTAGTAVNRALTTTNSTAALGGGTLQGTGHITANVSNSGGTVSPGNSPGCMTITGNYTQGAGGTLSIEIAGTTACTQYDQLTVTGTATLGGTLNVSLLSGF